MDNTTTWTVGVLCSGAERTLALAGGVENQPCRGDRDAAGALVVAATDRGRQEYRLTVADTCVIVVPGLTE
ncbi:hypothetical protein [Pseudonocardia sp. GCM10023141]|uniref:hypothetical protein n=1 Tax=Pseudonocardia sp. GCM10023141 TaxID=3252653 RepID=UPI0036201DF9